MDQMKIDPQRMLQDILDDVSHDEDGCTYGPHALRVCREACDKIAELTRRIGEADACDDKRCEECNAELTYCGEMTSDGPSLDCPVCQLSSELTAMRAEVERLTAERDAALSGESAWIEKHHDLSSRFNAVEAERDGWKAEAEAWRKIKAHDDSGNLPALRQQDHVDWRIKDVLLKNELDAARAANDARQQGGGE